MQASSRVTHIKRALRWLPVALLAVGLAACGGGSGSSMSTPTSAGIANVKQVSVGSITGFGSVHVNGKRFETTSATITVNGRVATQSDLKTGDVIEIGGHHDDATGQDVADTVEFRHNVQGPVTAIDTTAGTLVVLGQNVVVSADTFFGTGIAPASLSGLALNDIVDVSGMPAANGDIEASRIEKKAAGATYEVTGMVAGTDSIAKTLKINALTVDFTAATLINFPSTGPKDGDRIEATGNAPLGAMGQLMASRLELLTANESGQVNEEGEIEGLITRFASLTDFDIAGRPVTTLPSTTYEGGMSADLAINARVEAEGTFDAKGILEASKIRIHLKSASSTHLVGPVDMVDATAGTVTVLGITVSVNDMTHFEDEGPLGISTFKLSDVHTGDWLDIRGGEDSAGSNKVLATRFERVDVQSSVQLSGSVKTAAQPNFTILSVNVGTTTTTMFGDASNQPVTADAFFLNLVGQGVAVRGAWDGTNLNATRASLGEGPGD